MIKSVLWNIEGLKNVIDSEVYEYFKNFDIVMLTETFQLSSTTLKGFHVYEELAVREGVGRPIGGILVAVKPDLRLKDLFVSKYCVGIEAKTCLILNFYFNPILDNFIVMDEIIEQLNKIDLTKPCIVGGDFNARIDNNRNERAEILIELLEDFGFDILNDPCCPTYYSHNGSSTIDLYFSNFEVKSCEVETKNDLLFRRKHVPIMLEFETPVVVCPPLKEKKGKRRLVGEIDIERLEGVEAEIVSGNIDSAYKSICDTILDSVPDNIAVSKKRKYSQEIEDQKRRLRVMYNRMQKSPLLFQDHGRLAEEKRRYNTMIKDMKIKLAEEEENRRIEEAETLPWKLNARRNGMISCGASMDVWSPHFSQLYNDSQDKILNAEVLHDHSYSNHQPAIDPVWFTESNEFSVPPEITEAEVEETLRTCGNKKAAGSDMITNEHLKGSFPLIGPLWVLLFNCILASGKIVDIWRRSIVRVLYKGKGDNKSPDNYRGIALLSHVYKLFTKIIASKIYKFVENKSLAKEQFGFCKNRSTLDAFFKLRSYVTEALNTPRTPVYALFVDFRKAFDMVPRNLLIQKLFYCHGIRGRILSVIVSLLEYNLIQVFDGLCYTDDILQTRGVQQGDSLSPLLYILFVSDLPSLLIEVSSMIKVVMFADDLVFYSTCKTSVQQALDALSRYCSLNKMEVNLAKTKVLKFRRGGSANEVFTYNNNIIEHCSSYEYLGITLQPSWTFTAHLKKKRIKANAASYRIKDLQLLSMDGARKYFSVMI